jgi:replicative DNA helicase
MARLIAQQGNGVAFASGEMPNTENGLRLLSQAANHYNLNSVPYIKTYELEHLEKWVESLRTLPIYFDSKTTDVKTLGTYLRALVRTKGVKILVVDYIQLFKVEPNDRRSRYERISEVSQELKRLAVELEIGVLEVAQVNRVGAKGSELSIHDLDGSGQLEKDASNILIIEIQEDKRVKLRNDKGRNVGKSEIWGTWKGQTLNFEFEEGEVSVI